VHVSVVTIETR